MRKESILITGAGGQIGTVLTKALQEKHGAENLLATDLREIDLPNTRTETLNVLDKEKMTKLVVENRVTQIYHLAAILSAKGEEKPRFTWNINMEGLFNVLDVAKDHDVSKVFHPSSIAAFGPDTPRENTPQVTPATPTTVYGISKMAGEFWGNYYFLRYGLDIRSLRYPGIIGHRSLPGGGTTDYAVHIYHSALKGESFEVFLKENTALPMIYMDDAIRATLDLMDAPKENITIRDAYNLAGMTFTPAEIVASIKEEIPEFKATYKVNPLRQSIAESWPMSIDDSKATEDWGWKPTYDLKKMTKDMIKNLRKKYIFKQSA